MEKSARERKCDRRSMGRFYVINTIDHYLDPRQQNTSYQRTIHINNTLSPISPLMTGSTVLKYGYLNPSLTHTHTHTHTHTTITSLCEMVLGQKASLHLSSLVELPPVLLPCKRLRQSIGVCVCVFHRPQHMHSIGMLYFNFHRPCCTAFKATRWENSC